MTAAEIEARECCELCRAAIGSGPGTYGPGTELNGLIYIIARQSYRLPADLIARSEAAIAALRAERGVQ